MRQAREIRTLTACQTQVPSSPAQRSGPSPETLIDALHGRPPQLRRRRSRRHLPAVSAPSAAGHQWSLAGVTKAPARLQQEPREHGDAGSGLADAGSATAAAVEVPAGSAAAARQSSTDGAGFTLSSQHRDACRAASNRSSSSSSSGGGGVSEVATPAPPLSP